MTEKIGEGALMAIKNQNSAIAEFKIPAAPKAKKRQMEILTEEQYIEEMGKIIQKDFFPDLEKLQAQNEYLDALQKNDTIKLREIYAKYSGKKPFERFGSESPATFETPIRDTPSSSFSTPSTTSKKRKSSDTMSIGTSTSNEAPSDGHSLDSFLSAYTSEDNCSFQELIETADKKLRQKFSVLFDAEQETAIAVAKSLCLPSIEDQFRAICGPKIVDTWTYTNKNSIMYVPDGVELTKEEKLDLVNKKQEIQYSNTRLKNNPFDEQRSKETITEAARVQAKHNPNNYGIDGNTLSSSFTPNTRGYSYVKTPSPNPGANESPLMTWGHIEGTPFLLDGSDTPIRPSTGPSFHIAETSKRESIGLALAEKVGERMRDQKAKALETARRNIASPNIRSHLDRLASMSPAAKRLASSNIGIRDSLLTPSPMSTLSTRKSNTPSPLVRKKTPLVRTTPKAHATKPGLTDDLLNIPLKPKKS